MLNWTNIWLIAKIIGRIFYFVWRTGRYIEAMKDKKGGFLIWPWNIVIYVLLAVALRLYAIPVILILMGIQRKNNPHGVEDGYCLSRTRKKLSWVLWGLLWVVVGALLLFTFYMEIQQDRTYWETNDYVTLVIGGGGGLFFLFLGIYMGYVGVRDTFFPDKSALAASIRGQLPYPDEAPPVEKLFAMVDEDLKANGQWFDEMGIGQEWVLGELASRIDRIRGIFVVDKIVRHRSGRNTTTERVLQLVLVDDRWQKNVTDFKDPQELRAAADCLSLRVPDARRGTNDQWMSFCNADESEKEKFERDFRERQALRASEAAQRELVSGEPQDMILKRQNGEVTSRVTASLVEELLDQCLNGEETGFELTPTRPVEAQGRTIRSLNCFVQTEYEQNVQLLLELAAQSGEENLALTKVLTRREALEVLTAWLRREAPDLVGWDLRRMYEAPKAAQPQARKSYARLSLVYASGAAENHITFTGEDIRIAAEGIVDGTYQVVDLTHPEGYYWIRVTAGNRTDARCIVETAKPDGTKLEFYAAKMPPKEAAEWLTGYPHGQYLPGGRNWKRIKEN